jgi:hypothetical protein
VAFPFGAARAARTLATFYVARGKFCAAKLSFSTALLLKKKSSPRVISKATPFGCPFAYGATRETRTLATFYVARGKFCAAKLSFSTALLLKKKSNPRVAFPSKVLLMLQHYISLREFDIITKKCIIEVKSGKKPKGLVQFLGQKRYAESRNKRHIVFAPNISIPAKKSHEQSGITIVKDYKLLIETVKEHEK